MCVGFLLQSFFWFFWLQMECVLCVFFSLKFIGQHQFSSINPKILQMERMLIISTQTHTNCAFMLHLFIFCLFVFSANQAQSMSTIVQNTKQNGHFSPSGIIEEEDEDNEENSEQTNSENDSEI